MAYLAVLRRTSPARCRHRSQDRDGLGGTDPAAPHVTLDGESVDTAIRAQTYHVGFGRRHSGRTAAAGDRQREIIATARVGVGIVVEGRDIGTVVALTRISRFSTASAHEARRRRSTEDSTELALPRPT
jgi:cytidylate kinase